MWAFLAFVVLGIYFFVRWIWESATEDAFYKTMENKKKSADSFLEKYGAGVSEVTQLRNDIMIRKPEVVAIRDELQRAMGYDFEPTIGMYLWGNLAKKGRVPDYLRITIETPENVLFPKHDILWSEMLGWKTGQIDTIRNARLGFLIWMDKELRNNGMNEELLYVHRDENGAFNPRKNTGYISNCNTLKDTAVFWKSLGDTIVSTMGANYPYWK